MPKRIVLEHNLANDAGIRDGAGFGLFQISASQGFKKAAVNVDPKVALQVIMRFRYIKHAWQHQPLHQFNQPPVASGVSNDQMEVCISLNLFTILIDATVGRLLCFFDYLLKPSEVIFSKLSETQLNSEQVESIDKSKNLGVVGISPGTQIESARRPTLNDSDLLKAMECIAHGCPAHIESMGEVLFAKPLVGDKLAVLDSIKDFENNPVGECTVNGLRGEP